MSKPQTTRHPYSTAPKDGRLIGLLADDVGGPFPMRWDPDAVNPLVGDVRGLWVMEDGSMTWSDHDPAGAPTHWQEIVQ